LIFCLYAERADDIQMVYQTQHALTSTGAIAIYDYDYEKSDIVQAELISRKPRKKSIQAIKWWWLMPYAYIEHTR